MKNAKKSTKRHPKSVPTTEIAQTKAAQLEALLPQIQGQHEQVECHLAATLEYAQQAGELLIAAKKLTGHGGWLAYVKKCGIPARTASDYMRIAKNWTKAKSATLPDLSYRGAIAYLRSKEKAEQEALDRARALEQDRTSGEKFERMKARYEAGPVQPPWTPAEATAAELAEKQAKQEAAERKLTMAQDLITAGYKVMAAKLHSDKGGSNGTMAELNKLRDDLQQIVESTYDLVRS
jgi:hypothetical protein